jgi:hypothetical protein
MDPFEHRTFKCPDRRNAAVLLEAMITAGLLASLADESTVVVKLPVNRVAKPRGYQRLQSRMIGAASRSGAEWIATNSPQTTGPRAGTRGAFSEGPTHRARARRRGKKENRRRVRHVVAQSVRTGVDRPAKIRDYGARMPRQMQSPFLDPEDLDAST